MNYSTLQSDILEIFEEAQHKGRREAVVRDRFEEWWRVFRPRLTNKPPVAASMKGHASGRGDVSYAVPLPVEVIENCEACGAPRELREGCPRPVHLGRCGRRAA